MKRTDWLVDTAALILLAVVSAAGATLGRFGHGPWARRAGEAHRHTEPGADQ